MTTTINASTTLGLQQTADTSGILQLQTANTAALTIDASQNVGIGTSSPVVALDVYGAVNLRAGYNLTWGGTYASNKPTIFADTNYIAFAPVGASSGEKMRIDSGGNLLVGTTTALNVSGVASSCLSLKNPNNNGSWSAAIQSSGATSNRGAVINYSGAAPNDAFNEAIYFVDSSGQRFALRSNGGIANYSANNVNLSDERTKTDIVDAGNYLDKICAIPVRTFKYKDQTDDLLNLGVIAQEVETVAPELVDVSGFGETPEDGVPLKAIYQTDLQYALMKCIQEQQALITTLTERVAALENK